MLISLFIEILLSHNKKKTEYRLMFNVTRQEKIEVDDEDDMMKNLLVLNTMNTG